MNTANQISYSLINHHNQKRISIVFAYNETWNVRLRKTAGAKWSKTLQCWHIPDTDGNRMKCGFIQNQPIVLDSTTPQLPSYTIQHLSDNNKIELQKFLQHLHLKSYSISTIKTYRNEFTQLLTLLKAKHVQDLTPEKLQQYFLYCKNQGLS